MDYLPWVTTLGGFVVGVLPSYVVIRKSRVDVNQTITDGFKGLVDQLQEDRAALTIRINQQDLKIEQQQVHIRKLEAYINILQWHTHTLETVMKAAGMEVPILTLDAMDRLDLLKTA